jgi:hypothetical protein
MQCTYFIYTGQRTFKDRAGCSYRMSAQYHANDNQGKREECGLLMCPIARKTRRVEAKRINLHTFDEGKYQPNSHVWGKGERNQANKIWVNLKVTDNCRRKQRWELPVRREGSDKRGWRGRMVGQSRKIKLKKGRGRTEGICGGDSAFVPYTKYSIDITTFPKRIQPHQVSLHHHPTILASIP